MVQDILDLGLDPDSSKAPTRLDILCGVNPHVEEVEQGSDKEKKANIRYERVQKVIAECEMFLVIGCMTAPTEKEGVEEVTTSFRHNIPSLDTHRQLLKMYNSFINHCAKQEASKSGPKIIQPGDPGYFMAKQRAKFRPPPSKRK